MKDALNNLNSLPRYIEAPSGAMWGPMPDGFSITNKDSIFVKLKDVEALFQTPVAVTVHGKVIRQHGEEYVSVGPGGQALVDAAKNYNWTLYSAGLPPCSRCSSEVTGPWLGDDPEWEYYIKKETDA